MNVGELILKHTRGSGNIDRLLGPSGAEGRSEILSAIKGVKVPKSKAGFMAMREALYGYYNVPKSYIAAMEKAVTAGAKAEAGVAS